jgi:hypothetical protein
MERVSIKCWPWLPRSDISSDGLSVLSALEGTSFSKISLSASNCTPNDLAVD